MNTLRPHHESLEIPELEIQKEAHRLWLEKGRPEGRDLETWLEARELLKHRAHPAIAAASEDERPASAAAATAGRPGRTRRQGRAA